MKKIPDYIEFYNTNKLNSSLYYLASNDYSDGCSKEKPEIRESKLQEARKNRILTRKAV